MTSNLSKDLRGGEILKNLAFNSMSGEFEHIQPLIEEAKQQLLDLMLGCVPEKPDYDPRNGDWLQGQYEGYVGAIDTIEERIKGAFSG